MEMHWTREHLETLYANVFQRRLICPTCGGSLAFEYSNELDVTGTVQCRACDARHVISIANDPLRETFREYTPEENRVIFRADRNRQTPICPVDGTPMDVHLQRSLGLTSNTQIRCRRCGREAKYVRLYG